MEKKTTLTLVVLLLVLCCAVGFVACDPVGGEIPPTEIVLNKTTLTLNVGESETLIATVLPENASVKRVNWESDNPDITQVDASGRVRAIAPGSATITVTDVYSGRVQNACSVTVIGNGGDDEDDVIRYKSNTDGQSYYVSSVDNSITTITIPAEYNGKPVTGIGELVFRSCENLTSVTLPDSITFIDDYAFAQCEGLISINMPQNPQGIGDGAFSGCHSLSNITIPDSVKTIGDGAFSSCRSLSNITIPDSVKTIGDMAFSYSGLTSVTLHAGVSVAGNAFRQCDKMVEINIPQGVTVVGALDLSMCEKLERATILADVAVIGTDFAVSGGFDGCKSLKSVTLPDTLKTIDHNAFSSCAELIEITLPDGVETIGAEAFAYCSKLERINIPDSVESIGNKAFLACGNLLSITIPSGITTIEEYTFSGCEKLTCLTIWGDEVSFDENAFGYHSHFTQAKMSTKTLALAVDRWFFRQVKDLTFISGEEITSEMAQSLRNITSLTLPESITTIATDVFAQSTDLVTVNWNITDFRGQAQSLFASCNKLTTVNIGDSVNSIPDNAFKDCKKLQNVTIGENVKSIGNNAFSGCLALSTLTLNEGLTSLGDIDNMPLLASLTIPSTVTQAGNISNCAILAEVIFTEGVDLGNATFENCPNYHGMKIGAYTLLGTRLVGVDDSVTTAIIPSAVTAIAANVFTNATRFRYIYIPASVKRAESGAFDGCTATIFVGGSTSGVSGANLTIYRNVGECTSDGWIYKVNDDSVSVRAHIGESGGEVSVPAQIDGKNVTEIGSATGALNNVLLERDDITKITINSAGTVSVVANAFSNCANLAEIAFGADVAQVNISNTAFDGCDNLVTISLAGGYDKYEINVASFSTGSVETMAITDGADLYSMINNATNSACAITLKAQN